MMDIVMMAVASKDKIAAPMMIPVIIVFSSLVISFVFVVFDLNVFKSKVNSYAYYCPYSSYC